MVTTPKSAGVNSRARVTVAMIWTASPTPWEARVTPALRTVRRRSVPSCATGRNLLFSSKGFNASPEVFRVGTEGQLGPETEPGQHACQSSERILSEWPQFLRERKTK